MSAADEDASLAPDRSHTSDKSCSAFLSSMSSASTWDKEAPMTSHAFYYSLRKDTARCFDQTFNTLTDLANAERDLRLESLRSNETTDDVFSLIVLRTTRTEFSVAREQILDALKLNHSERSPNSSVFETPTKIGPYLRISLGNAPPTTHGHLLGVVFHDTNDFEFDFVSFVTSALSQDATYMGRYLKDGQVRGPDYTMFAFSQIFLAWLAERYLKTVQAQAEPIGKQLNSINDSLRNDPMQSLSNLLLRLTRCSSDIRAFELDQNTTWALNIAHQAGRELMALEHDPRAYALLAWSNDDQATRPVRLKERIAELRAQISDISVARIQERDEKKQQRYEERQKRKDELRAEREVQEAEYRAQADRLQKLKDEFQERRDRDEVAYRKREQDLQNFRDDIMLRTVRDSRTMRGVAWMTMAFLPATFVTSFFGMNFFNAAPGNRVFDESSRNVWVFFVVALPISAVILVAF